MKNINKRIKWILQNKCDNNVARMSREIDKNPTNIRNYTNDRDPSVSFIVKLKKTYNITHEWLLDEPKDVDIVSEPVMTYGNNSPVEMMIRDKERIIQLLEADNARLRAEIKTYVTKKY